MRKWAWILALLMLLGGAARAEDLGSAQPLFDGFEVDGAAWTEEVEGRLWSISPAKDVLVSACVEAGELVALSVTAPRGGDCDACARRAMLALGLAEAEVDALLADTTPDPEAPASRVDARRDGRLCVRVTGALREGVYLCADGAMDALYWQPLHGGVDRHLRHDCSGMDVPRLIDERSADALGFPPCSKCAGGAPDAKEVPLDDAA